MSYAITIVLVRLFAAYIIFQGLISFVSYLQVWPAFQGGKQDLDFVLLAQVALILAIMLVGAGLWLFSRMVAERVIGVAHPDTVSIEADDIVAAGSFIIGLSWFTYGLWEFVTLIAVFGMPGPFPLASVLGAIGSIGLSFVLMVGTRKIVMIFKTLRQVGH